MPDKNLGVGDVLGAYEIVRKIGEGGMGAVFEARHRITKQRRALKVMLPSLAENADFVERFMREVTIAATIEHPHLVRVFEPGMEGENIFLPMELLEGEPLSQRIRRVRVFDSSPMLAIMLPVCRAVAALHTHKVIHRDLKPANVFLARSDLGTDVPKVLDFGAARLTESGGEATRTGTIIGTPQYMPYEQAVGQRDIDDRVDQYALGVMMYQMLTGTKPYEDDDHGHAYVKVIQGLPIISPRQIVTGIPEALERVVLCAMARDRKDRYPTVDALIDALENFQRDEPTMLASQAQLLQRGQRIDDITLAAEHAPQASAVTVPPTTQSTQDLTPGRGSKGKTRAVIGSSGALVLLGIVGSLLLFRGKHEVQSPTPGATAPRTETPTGALPAAEIPATLSVKPTEPVRAIREQNVIAPRTSPTLAIPVLAVSVDAGVANTASRPLATQPVSNSSTTRRISAGHREGSLHTVAGPCPPGMTCE